MRRIKSVVTMVAIISQCNQCNGTKPDKRCPGVCLYTATCIRVILRQLERSECQDRCPYWSASQASTRMNLHTLSCKIQPPFPTDAKPSRNRCIGTAAKASHGRCRSKSTTATEKPKGIAHSPNGAAAVDVGRKQAFCLACSHPE
jgi:hypothetical protein